MEKQIKERYNDAILGEAMSRYGIAPDQIQLLDGFESFTYEFQRDGNQYILRIGHSRRRNPGLIQGEVDWINYLADGGASVAAAVTSDKGALVELLEDGRGGHFLATVFVKALGKPPWEVGWSHELYERYGRLLGRMHALSRGYQPADPAWTRPQWDDHIMLDVEDLLPASETLVVDRFRELLAHLGALTKDDASYGLIHFDAHAGNMFVDEDLTITLFDFDDCNYSWYINDIAIALFYMAMGANNNPEFAEEFMKRFLRGYRLEHRLDARWLAEIPYFLKLREIDLYAIIHRSFDVENLDDAWVASYMDGRKARIEAGVPYLDADFESLERYL